MNFLTNAVFTAIYETSWGKQQRKTIDIMYLWSIQRASNFQDQVSP